MQRSQIVWKVVQAGAIFFVFIAAVLLLLVVLGVMGDFGFSARP